MDLALSLKLKTLFQTIGSESRLLGILTEFYQILSKDILVGFFFESKDLNHLAKMQSQFLLKSMGQAQSYSGHSPAQAHIGLPPILNGHFDRRQFVLREVLVKNGLDQESINTWTDFENLFRSAIVK